MKVADDTDLGPDDMAVAVSMNEAHTVFTVVIWARRSMPLDDVAAELHELADGILSGECPVVIDELSDSN